MERRRETWGAVLFVDKSGESLRLLHELESRGALRAVKVVEVDGLRGWLILEYGVSRVPLLVTESRVISDPEEIISYLSRNRATVHDH